MKLKLLKMETAQFEPGRVDQYGTATPSLSFTFKAPGNQQAFVSRTFPPDTQAFEVAYLLRKMAAELEHMACAKELPK